MTEPFISSKNFILFFKLRRSFCQIFWNFLGGEAGRRSYHV